MRVMLIPFVNVDPQQAAREICNGYVNKLALEAYQCLLAALFTLDPEAYCRFRKLEEPPKSVGYKNHPFVRDWICKTEWAWNWTVTFRDRGM